MVKLTRFSFGVTLEQKPIIIEGKLRPLVFVSLLLLMPQAISGTEIREKRKQIEQTLADGLSHLEAHELYVPDFCDTNSHPDGPGAYFAAVFSSLFEHDTKHFAVLSRVEAHRFLLQNHWTDCDLARLEILQSFVARFGVDFVLTGRVSLENNAFLVDLVIREASGKARARCVYEESFVPGTLALFPAGASSSGWPFYFPTLDGVTFPKPLKPKAPLYPSYKVVRKSGTVIVSLRITAEGNVEQPRIVQKMDPDYDAPCLDATKQWHFDPAKTSDGTAVPVRLPIDCHFQGLG